MHMLKNPREIYDVRKDSTTGVIENENVKFHFSEWWNGEGMDCTFTKGEDNSLTSEITGRKVYSFDMYELQVLVTAAMYMNLVDITGAEDTVELLEENLVRKNRTLARIRKEKKNVRPSTTKEQEYD